MDSETNTTFFFKHTYLSPLNHTCSAHTRDQVHQIFWGQDPGIEVDRSTRKWSHRLALMLGA